jgi:hypothetical protein
MNLLRVVPVGALALLAVAVTGCATETGDGAAGGKVKMNEAQAIERAESILHQAVDGMSPKPTLKPLREATVGPCLARDDQSADDRVQVRLAYQLTDVPGSEAKNLVRQASDAWVERGYQSNSSGTEVDWSDPFPSVYMRTGLDDFWMDAITGVADRAKGDGLASISVTSPCFAPGSASSPQASPAALHPMQVNEAVERRAFRHSSQLYDALQARHAPAELGDGLRKVADVDGTSVHHEWSTVRLTEEEAAQAMTRAQEFFASEGWKVRHVNTGADAPTLVALNTEDGSVAQLAPSRAGRIRVAVTTPATREATDV